MRAVATDILLALAVLSAWFACWGFLRFATALGRLHWVAFANATITTAVVAAVWVQDGVSTRSLKALAILAILLIAGSATTHAAGRAIFLRGEEDR